VNNVSLDFRSYNSQIFIYIYIHLYIAPQKIRSASLGTRYCSAWEVEMMISCSLIIQSLVSMSLEALRVWVK